MPWPSSLLIFQFSLSLALRDLWFASFRQLLGLPEEDNPPSK